MKLYEIDNAIMDCVDFETGEILDIDRLNELQMERDVKIENVGLWIKDLKAEAEAIKKEKMALAERQKVAENKAESLKSWLAFALNGQAFETPKLSVSFRATKSVNVTDINALLDFDDSLVKFAEPTPDKAEIKKRILAGDKVAGAEISENVSTIIK